MRLLLACQFLPRSYARTPSLFYPCYKLHAMQGLARALAAAGAGEPPDADGDAADAAKAGPTLLLAPEECHLHHTCVLPIVRGGEEPPPENVDRLHVLTDPGAEAWILGTHFPSLTSIP